MMLGAAPFIFTGSDPHCCHQRTRASTLLSSRSGICQETGSGSTVSVFVGGCGWVGRVRACKTSAGSMGTPVQVSTRGVW